LTARAGLALFIGVPIAVFLAVVVLARRGNADEADLPGERVVARVASPDMSRVATVIAIKEVDGYLVRVDAQDAFLASGTKRLTVRWIDRRALEIRFVRARATKRSEIEGLRLVVKGEVTAMDKASNVPFPRRL